MNPDQASPNFFRLSNLLTLLVSSQLIVFVYWLVTDELLNWGNLGLFSIYCLWLILLSVGLARLFSVVSQKLIKLPALLVWGLACSLAMFIVECFAAYVMTNSTTWLPSPMRLFRFWLADMLVLLILARGWLFFLRVQELDRAESESRMQALQSRIQPHFLFNSLNTIAELTASMPEKAEEAIQSLAMLFRVSLENVDIQHSLKKEIALCKHFVSLEAWRFNQGIDIEYHINMRSTSKWLVPKLILQPLLENSIKYGAPSQTGEPIKLSIEETSKQISIKVSNAISETTDFIKGNGIAVKNIQDRLDALFDDKYTFSQRKVDSSHYLLIQIPKVRVKPTKH